MTGMTGPLWLAEIVGGLMLASSAYALLRIIAAWRSRTATDYSIEVCHGVMGVSMAGMLIPALNIVTPGPSTWVWVVVSAVITAWFALSVLRELSSPAPAGVAHARRLHHLPHLVLSGAMVYMLVAMGAMGSSASAAPATGASATSAGTSGMDMAAGGMLMPWPTLDLLLALFMIGYAILLTDRLPAIAQLGGVGEPRALTRDGAAALYAPRGAAALSIVMASGMAYMLVMMFA